MPPPGQTPLPDWAGLELRVRTLIASHRVMIFSKSYCPYCNKVRLRRRRLGALPPRARSSLWRPPATPALGAASPRWPRGGGGPGAAAGRGGALVPWGRPLARLAARPGGGKRAAGGGLERQRCGDAAACGSSLGGRRVETSAGSLLLKLSTRCRPLETPVSGLKRDQGPNWRLGWLFPFATWVKRWVSVGSCGQCLCSSPKQPSCLLREGQAAGCVAFLLEVWAPRWCSAWAKLHPWGGIS